MTVRAAWLINDTMSGEDIRVALTAKSLHDTAVRARSGVIPAPSNPLNVAIGSGMSVNVAAGQALIGGQRAGAQGEYHVTNDATLTLTVANGDASQPRTDVVVAYIRDTDYGDTTQAGGIGIVQGTPGPTFPVPTFTGTTALGTAIPLARVKVPAGASAGSGGLTSAGAVITDMRVWSTAAGGIVPVKDTSEASALTGYRGLYVDTGADGVLRRHNGMGWELARAGMPAAANLSAWYGSYSGQPLRLLGGHGTFTTNSGSYTNIAFGETVSGVKSVMVNGAVDGYDVTAHATAAYPTGFDVQLWNGSALLGATNIVLDWIALVW